MSRVLITGGTGFIGRQLNSQLINMGYDVAIISRRKPIDSSLPIYCWDPLNNTMDDNAFSGCEYIIHLAGENIGDRRWTPKRKQQIINSRYLTGLLLLKKVHDLKVRLKAFITASATGYYGAITSSEILDEDSAPVNDFLSTTCKKWEEIAGMFAATSVRTVIIRTGVVLASEGGALPRLRRPVQMGLGTVLGSGRQFMPWIHMKDLCNIYISALENEEMTGPYNAVSPEFVTNEQITRELAAQLDKPLWLPRIPSVFLRLVMGEMTDMVLKGSRISPEKLLSTGFTFNYPTLSAALAHILQTKH